MIRIIKFENVFGIKKLIGADAFDKWNVIYAPNGTAKSSISDALECISRQESIDDVYGNYPNPEFEIVVDGNTYFENDVIPLNIIKYSGLAEYELENPEEYESLVVSNALKTSVYSSKKIINDSQTRIANALSSAFSKKGKGRAGELFSKNLLETLSIIAKTSEKSKLILSLVDNLKVDIKPIPFSVTEDDIYNCINKNVFDALNNPTVKQELNEFVKIINEKKATSIVDDNFSIDNLNSFFQHSVDDNYFDDGLKRRLLINDKPVGLDGFKELVEKENALIYGSDEVKTKIEECKVALSKNAGTRKFISQLSSNPQLGKYASDRENFVNALFVSFLGESVVELIKTEKAIIKTEQAKLESLKSSMDDSDTVLPSVWSKFSSRFPFEKYELKVQNKFDALMGFEAPRFVKCQPHTDLEIDDPTDLRFSTGEIRSFNLINAILEIERMRMKGEPFTLVLDDAVDSFDYKNKYGIIDYLVDIKDDPNIQIIAFTHNFDFYRTLVLSLGKSSTNRYFMYKNSANEVTLYDTRNKPYYLELANFNQWKRNPTLAQYFSFIPFARNILQLQRNANDPDVQIIDSFLHYDINSSETSNFANIARILSTNLNCCFPTCISQGDIFIKKLEEEALRICSTAINETDLENKILLGFYIRIFLERFLSLRIRDVSGLNPIINDHMRTYACLMNQAKAINCLSSEEISLASRANIVSPSFLHANSFMYEPLIDVDSSPLIRLVNEIKNKNSQWPL